jgi:hypothetical protein
VFRYNIYDLLDDFFDAYDIFLCDFIEHDLNLSLFSLIFNNLIFKYNNINDSIIDNIPKEIFTLDIYLIYFFIFGIIYSLFILFLEIFLRLVLATVVMYFIVLEIKLCSIFFNEDKFFLNKKLKI